MINCNLCPRQCNIDRKSDKKGFCNSYSEIRVARIAPHYWEEPCICGEHGSGTVFFVGCNLRCSYCQNKEISRGGNIGKVFTVSELADELILLQQKQVSNINFVTPTHYSNYIPEILDIAWSKGLYIPVIYNCGGYERVETLKKLNGYISIYMPDFKYISSDISLEYSKAEDYPEIAKNALREMVYQRELYFSKDGELKKGVIVRHLVLPGLIEESKKVLSYLFAEYENSIIYSIMGQYTPVSNCPSELNRKLDEREYSEIVDFALKLGISNAYIQEVGSAEESFIPKWDFLK